MFPPFAALCAIFVAVFCNIVGGSFSCEGREIKKYPDPTDCFWFYQCRTGLSFGTRMPCGAGTAFDFTSQLCLVPAHQRCLESKTKPQTHAEPKTVRPSKLTTGVETTLLTSQTTTVSTTTTTPSIILPTTTTAKLTTKSMTTLILTSEVETPAPATPSTLTAYAGNEFSQMTRVPVCDRGRHTSYFRRHKFQKVLQSDIDVTYARNPMNCGSVCLQYASCTGFNFRSKTLRNANFTGSVCEVILDDNMDSIETSRDFAFYQLVCLAS